MGVVVIESIISLFNAFMLQLNFCDLQLSIQPRIHIIKPEDQWSCKRSPDIWALYKHKTYKTWIKMAEQTLTLITHNPSFTQSFSLLH